MSKKEADISLIRKYLNGELDARAMHQLERRAQDDPFLMDALEGYENVGNGGETQLNELSDRLRQRLQKKKGRVIPLMIIGIAASVLIVCSVGVWLITRDNKTPQAKIAINVNPAKKSAPAELQRPAHQSATEKAPAKPLVLEPVRPQQLATVKQAAEQVKKPVNLPKNILAPVDKTAEVVVNAPVQKDSTPLDELVVMNYSAKKKKDVNILLSNADKNIVKTGKDTTPVQLLQGHVAGVTANNQNAPKQQYGVVPLGTTSKIKLNDISTLNKVYTSSKKIITGQVVAKEDGLPIPGVTVKIAGTNVGTQTDSNGRFNLNADSGKANLVVGYIGYETKRVSANTRDSSKTIELQLSSNQLAEVVVTKRIEPNNTEDNAVVYSHPQEGWSSFRKYLKEAAISPDGKKGVVKLSFMVDRYGRISDIEVRKGLSPATDKAAIDMVNKGPRWVGSSNNQPEKVNLRIRFEK